VISALGLGRFFSEKGWIKYGSSRNSGGMDVNGSVLM
jgi:hypothetical protein